MLFLDTNVLLDILDDSRECHGKALMLLAVFEQGVVEACVSSQSIIDASYVQTQARKLPLDAFREDIRTISSIVKIVAINDVDIKRAVSSALPDYEDAAQLCCAERNKVEAIVTSDAKYRKYTRIPTVTVDEFYDSIFSK